MEPSKRTAGTGKSIIMRIVPFLLAVFIAIPASAQYFGRNKPGYENFRYNVIQTPNFEIYHYLKNDSVLSTLYQWSEKWYNIHSNLFRDTFRIKNPLIFYNNHADFQQTNTISGLLGSGTGGVTESLKNRVIMPVAPTLAQTDHTLGHELVHAFQYNVLLHSDSSKLFSINNLPLWMIEGMAEYLSIGSLDPNTSMWMRDALVNNDFPTIKKLSDQSKYFPYRYGQAFWAMAGKTWGDTIIMPLFRQTAQYGFEAAVDSVLGFNTETLSGMWKSAMELHYNRFIEGRKDQPAGREMASEGNGGKYYISPALSPDGKYLAFFSERNLFTLDLFLADTETGKIVKKLSSVIRDTDIDDFSFIESAGTWSPDSRQFAFVVFSKGKNRLAIVNVRKARKVREVELKGVPSFSNPSWSPDGNRIVVTGMVDGVSDLFAYDTETGAVERLTNDLIANIHPSWSPDGSKIVYSQEVINNDPGARNFAFRIAVYDLNTRKTELYDVFPGAYNMNPVFSADGNSIFFLSDADGFRNLYRYDPLSDQVVRLTDLITGISGITAFSPAISIAREKDLIAYTYYTKNSYQLWLASADEFSGMVRDKREINLDAGTLPPLRHYSYNLVDTVLYNNTVVTELPVDSVKEVPYRAKFKLDYISNNASIGVSTGLYRNNVGGSVNMIFSDMLGNNQLFSSLALNGEIYDFGGQVAYINQKSKVKWGGAVSHIPYRAGNMFMTLDSLGVGEDKFQVYNLVLDYLRMFEDNISAFAYYPISQNRRIESSFSMSWYYYRIDRYNNYYTLDGLSLGSKREKMDSPDGGNYQLMSLAYVEDNSYFAMTSPFQGHRLRYQVEKYFGMVDFFTALADYRRYFYIKPFSLAFRAYHYGRYGGKSGNNIVSPLYLGYPWLIRGYENISSNQGSEGLDVFDVSRLSGQRVLVGNVEFRLPLSGPERLALIKSKIFFTDLNLFFDGGVAWSKGDRIVADFKPSALMYDVKYPVYSTGVSLRINVLGAMILEPYYAFPLQNGGFSNGIFGLNFTPGW